MRNVQWQLQIALWTNNSEGVNRSLESRNFQSDWSSTARWMLELHRSMAVGDSFQFKTTAEARKLFENWVGCVHIRKARKLLHHGRHSANMLSRILLGEVLEFPSEILSSSQTFPAILKLAAVFFFPPLTFPPRFHLISSFNARNSPISRSRRGFPRVRISLSATLPRTGVQAFSSSS